MSAGEQLPPELAALPPEVAAQLMAEMGAAPQEAAPQEAAVPVPPPVVDPIPQILSTIDKLAVAAAGSAGSNPEGSWRLMQGVLAGAQAVAELVPDTEDDIDAPDVVEP